jgi:hypothetical protein
MIMSSSQQLPYFVGETTDKQSLEDPLAHRTGGVRLPGFAHLVEHLPHLCIWTIPVGKDLVSRWSMRGYSTKNTVFLLQFPSTRMIASLGDICVYERMFLAGVLLPFSLIVTKLLSFLGIAPGQLMHNGRSYFLATFLLCPSMFPGETISVPKFLNIYGHQIYPTYETVTFMVCRKNQFIELESTYSNNKHWVEKFFTFSELGRCMHWRPLPLQHSNSQEWGVPQESCEYS